MGFGRSLRRAGRRFEGALRKAAPIAFPLAGFAGGGPLGGLVGLGLGKMLGGRGRNPNLPSTPTMADPAVLAAQEEERKRSQRGYSSTIKTSAQGLLSSPSLASRTLFG